MITFHESDMIATTASGDVEWGDWDDENDGAMMGAGLVINTGSR